MTLTTALTAALSALALALAVPGAAAATAPDPAAPRVVARACPVAVPANTTCGFLVVPERRGVPGSRLIQVGYAVHRATAADRKPDPVVYTSGGPGSSSLQLTGFLAGTPFGRDRDVVVVEQRGSRWSAPFLRCPEVDVALLDALSRPGSDAAEAAALTEAGRRCGQRLAAEGIDLRGYTTAEIAADVVALRSALGYPSWNLLGVSYSTRSMLAAAAADPQGTRSVVLDSFLPAEVRYYDTAARNLRETLDRVSPGLAGRLAQVVRRLNDRPTAVRITDPLTGGPRTLRLSGDDVASLIAEGMQDADLVTAVPPLVDALQAGRYDLLGPIGQIAGDTLTSHDTGLHYAVSCQDEVPFNRFDGVEVPRSFYTAVDPALCRGFGLPAGSAAGATTGAPVLVVGGALDPATPVGTAREVAARTLPNADTVEFAGVAHAVFLTSRCGRETIAAFLADPARDARPCDPAVSPYVTLPPDGRHVTTRAYALATDPWRQLPVPAALVLACVGAVLAGAVRRRVALVFAGLAGLLPLAAAGWLFADVGQHNPASLLVGVPWSVAALAVAAGAAPALAAALILLHDRRRAPGPGAAGFARRCLAPLLLIGASTAHLVWWALG